MITTPTAITMPSVMCHGANGHTGAPQDCGASPSHSHFAQRLPAEALTVDTSILTAIGNDYGYDLVFSRQLEGKATASDVFLGITTSGKSPNILKALEQCRILGIPSIVFCGHDGGQAKVGADFAVVVPGLATSTIQELHIVLAHTLCECVEEAMFGE